MSTFTGTVLVTGGTLGLGYQAALQIAKQRPDYQIVVCSRKDSETSAAAINKTTGHNSALWLPLDLSNLTKIRSFVDDFSKKNFPPIKALLLNAGLQITAGISYSDEGIESTFAVNHVGHALLFYLMRPYLATDARVVITASGVHDPVQTKGKGIPDAKYTSAEELAHPTPETIKNDGRQRYATSKLANVLWAYALDKHLSTRVSGKKWTVTMIDPGLMPGTGLARDAAPFLRFLWLKVLPHLIWLLRIVFSPNVHTDVESGFALARLAVGSDVAGKSGVYYEGLNVIKTSGASYEVAKQEDLWDWTINTVAQSEAEKVSFASV